MGGVNWTGDIKTHTAAPLQCGSGEKWAVSNANPRALGYYLQESNAIVPIDHCDVLSPGLADTFARLQEITRSGALPAEVLEIEAFVDSSDTKIALNIAFKEFKNPVPELTKLFHDTVPALHSLLLLDQKTNCVELSYPS